MNKRVKSETVKVCKVLTKSWAVTTGGGGTWAQEKEDRKRCLAKTEGQEVVDWIVKFGSWD